MQNPLGRRIRWSLTHIFAFLLTRNFSTLGRERHLLITAALALFASSCTRADQTVDSGPSLVLTLTTVLAESDSFFTGRPLGFAVGTDSLRFLVTDLAAGRVLAWNNAGRAVAAWGRVGRGPGEFLGPAAVVRQNDLLWVADYGSLTWKAIRNDDGVEVARIPFIGDFSYATPSRFSDTLLFGLRNATRKTAVGLLVEGDSVVSHAVSIPGEYARHEDVGIGRMSAVLPVVSGELRAVGFGPLDGLYLLNERLAIIDSVVLPTMRRRGVSARRVRAAAGGYAALMNSICALSLLRAMERPGRVLAVHYDNQVASEDGPIVNSTLYVSVVDLASRRACVDARVPNPGDARPAVQVRGDTLFVLRQEIAEARISTVVDQYVIDTSACNWLKLSTGPMLSDGN